MPKARIINRVAPQGFVTAPSDYDGTNDNQLRGADLTGNADGKQGTFSAWIKKNGNDGATNALLFNTASVNQGIAIRVNTNNNLSIVAANAANTIILSFTVGAAGALLSSTVWHHLLASWNLAVPGAIHGYIDDVNVAGALTTFTDDTIDYTKANFAIGSTTAAASRLNADLCELFFHNTYIDLSIIANRRKFRDQYGRPVYLGADGSRPLGVQPLIYAPNGDASTNLGSGGNFTTTGALTACATTP